MKKEIEIMHPLGRKLFASDASLKKLMTGLQFAEGPVWHPDGYLLASDIPANRIFMFFLNGVTNVVMHNSGGPCIVFTHLSKMIGSNGLAVDENNNVIICQHGNHSISKLDVKKNCTVLCCSFDGKPLNSPNDVVIKSNGAIYFTDPPYGLKDEILNPLLFQQHAGVYKFENNQLSLLTAEMKYPNGICFSRDEKYLFVSNSDPDDQKIYRYQVDNYGQVFNKEVFAMIGADGIKTDENNNLYAATAEGIVIFSATGQPLAIINTGEMCTNIAFGGKEKNLLFITTPSTIYYTEILTNKLRAESWKEALRYAEKQVVTNRSLQIYPN